jgi:ion channel-forming bestrophin family protein
MIVPGRPRITQIARYVGRPLALLFVWDVFVTVVYLLKPGGFAFPSLPLSLFGSALIIYLGFRNATAYARWWEARTLWGAIVNHSRSLAREADLLLANTLKPLQRTLTLRQIAYVHALRLHLRRQTPWGELAGHLEEEEIERLHRVANVPNAILLGTADLIGKHAELDSVRLATMETTLRELTNAQGGMERIRNTPFPAQYASYPVIFTQIFCILLPLGLVDSLRIYTPIGSTGVGFLFLALLQIGNDMEHPFANTVNDVPMSALTRTIEIDLRDGLGEEHGLAPVQPDKGVLW